MPNVVLSWVTIWFTQELRSWLIDCKDKGSDLHGGNYNNCSCWYVKIKYGNLTLPSLKLGRTPSCVTGRHNPAASPLMDGSVSVEGEIVQIDPFSVLSQPQRTCPELYTKKWLSTDSCFHWPHILQEWQLKNKQTAWNLYHMKSLLLNHSTFAFTVHGNGNDCEEMSFHSSFSTSENLPLIIYQTMTINWFMFSLATHSTRVTTE